METVEIYNHELNEEELQKVAGGYRPEELLPRFVCNLESNYLAIRSYPSFELANELGSLYNNQIVYSTEKYNGIYVWVYADTNYDPIFNKQAYHGYGWVNSRFLSK